MEAKQLVLDAIIERARELSFEPSFQSTKIVEASLASMPRRPVRRFLISDNTNDNPLIRSANYTQIA